MKGLKGCKTLNKDPDPKNPLEGKEDRSVWILVNSYEEFSLMHEKQIRLLFLALPHWIFADLATVFRFRCLASISLYVTGSRKQYLHLVPLLSKVFRAAASPSVFVSMGMLLSLSFYPTNTIQGRGDFSRIRRLHLPWCTK